MANAPSIKTSHQRPPPPGRRWLAPSTLCLLALSLSAGCEFAPPLASTTSLPDARAPTDLPRDVPRDAPARRVPSTCPSTSSLDVPPDAPRDLPEAPDAPDAPEARDAPADHPDACAGPGRALCEGACVSLTADPHCGACGNRCSFANASATCATGRCVMGACDRDFADCNASPTDGCEVNIAVGDAAHCGACGRRCPAPPVGGRAVCSAGTCGISTLMCPSGLRDCNGVALDGCEAAVLTDVDHCGSCGARCPAVGGVASCAGGLCAIACSTGLGNCDGMAANGCETNVRASDALRRVRPQLRAHQRPGGLRGGRLHGGRVQHGLRRLRPDGGQRLRDQPGRRQPALRRAATRAPAARPASTAPAG
ncbi:MAG: hypothetical protein IPF99_35625 [Deltaproteobacteria bacterium]|nr:hypothetical protein [Deltaproteobacteria bacterium]